MTGGVGYSWFLLELETGEAPSPGPSLLDSFFFQPVLRPVEAPVPAPARPRVSLGRRDARDAELIALLG